MTGSIGLLRRVLPLCLCIAAAQPGEVIPVYPGGVVGRMEAERAMAAYSRCIVDRPSLDRRVERYLRLLPEEMPRRIDRMPADRTCVPLALGGGTQMRYQHDLFRLALFSALYQRDFGATPPSFDLASLPPLRLSDEFDRPSEIPDSVRAFRAVGDCVARADADSVHALLVTRIGSDDERNALGRVMPALANCLPAERQARFSRTMLRGILAEALHKLRAAADRASRVAREPF